MRKSNNKNRFMRLITLPVRFLNKAKNFYVKSMFDCAERVSYGNAMGVGSGQISFLPKSLSVNSSRSNNDGDDLRELIRASSTRSLGNTNRIEMDLCLQHHIRWRSRMAPAEAASVMPRSCSVGMGRIDEDGPCDFGDQNIDGRVELVYPRSRRYAVIESSVVC